MAQVPGDAPQGQKTQAQQLAYDIARFDDGLAEMEKANLATSLAGIAKGFSPERKAWWSAVSLDAGMEALAEGKEEMAKYVESRLSQQLSVDQLTYLADHSRFTAQPHIRDAIFASQKEATPEGKRRVLSGAMNPDELKRFVAFPISQAGALFMQVTMAAQAKESPLFNSRFARALRNHCANAVPNEPYCAG